MKTNFQPKYIELIVVAESDEQPTTFLVKSAEGHAVKFSCRFDDLAVLASQMGFGNARKLARHLDGLNEFLGTILDIDGTPKVD